MAEHYFTESPESQHRPLDIRAQYRGHSLTFRTDSGVFSRTEIDKGSAALLAELPEGITGSVLDMGCGYGAIGVCLKKHNPACRLTMADINERAVALAKENAARNDAGAEVLQSDGFEGLPPGRYDLIVTNPPIRAGKQVVYRIFEGAARALAPRGAFMLVVRKQQGAPSAVSALHALFGTVDILTKKGGFWVIRCENPQSQ